MRVGLGQNVVRLLKFYVINQCDSLDLQERFLVCTFVNFEDEEKKSERYACYSLSYVGPYLEKIVPEDLRPRAVHKTGGTVFPSMDRPKLLNNIFIFKPKQIIAKRNLHKLNNF